MTAEIAGCLQAVLKPFGVAVVVEAAHQCMTTRGVHKTDVTMVTSRMLGAFRNSRETRQEFLSALQLKHRVNKVELMVDDKLKGPDLTLGVAPGELAEGAMLLGHVGDKDVLLVRVGEEIFAVGAACTHITVPSLRGW